MITMVYIAKAACGCTVGVVADNPDAAKQVSKIVQLFIESGLHVNRIPADEVEIKQCRCYETQISLGGLDVTLPANLSQKTDDDLPDPDEELK